LPTARRHFSRYLCRCETSRWSSIVPTPSQKGESLRVLACAFCVALLVLPPTALSKPAPLLSKPVRCKIRSLCKTQQSTLFTIHLAPSLPADLNHISINNTITIARYEELYEDKALEDLKRRFPAVFILQIAIRNKHSPTYIYTYMCMHIYIYTYIYIYICI
jgi:hypothetical protein